MKLGELRKLYAKNLGRFYFYFWIEEVKFENSNDRFFCSPSFLPTEFFSSTKKI